MKRKRRKMTPEERQAELARREDLTKRLQERIDYYRARVAEADRRAEGSA
jgi:hypothetical protein